MNIALWVVAGLLAMAFSASGAMKVLQPREKLAAVGLGLLMIGAMITHLRRHEARNVAAAVILLALAAFVAWGRLGPEPFTG